MFRFIFKSFLFTVFIFVLSLFNPLYSPNKIEAACTYTTVSQVNVATCSQRPSDGFWICSETKENFTGSVSSCPVSGTMDLDNSGCSGGHGPFATQAQCTISHIPVAVPITCSCTGGGGGGTCNSSNCQIFCDSSCNEYRASCVTSSSCQSTGSLIASNTSACNGVGGLSCPPPSSTCTPGTGTTKASCGNQPSQYKCQGVSTCEEVTWSCRPTPINSTSTCTLDSHASAAQSLCCPGGGTCSNGSCTVAQSGNAWSCSGSSCVNVGAGNGSFPDSSCNGTCTAPPISCQQCSGSTCSSYSYSNGSTCPTNCSAGCGGGGGVCMNPGTKLNAGKG